MQSEHVSCLDCPPQLAPQLKHINESMRREWSFLRETELDSDILEIMDDLAEDPPAVARVREEALARWTKRAFELQAQREAFRAELPEHLMCTVGRIHVPLMREMLLEAGHEDKHFLDDLLDGFPVVGEMGAGGIGREAPGGVKRGGKPAHGVVPPMEDFRASCRETNLRTIARARADDHSRDVWEKTKKEVEKGQVRDLRPLEEVDLSTVLLTHRFGIEQTGSSGVKVRPIDNYKSNGANDMTVTWEKTNNDREDVISECILSLQRRLHERGLDDQVLVGLDDFVGAFRTLAPAQNQRWLMHLLVYDTDHERWLVG